MYEDIVLMQGDEAREPLTILDQDGEEAAIDFLKQWHNPGEHPRRYDTGAGTSDTIYKDDDGYILVYNWKEGYIGLCYKEKE
jgi:hypothetical protein